MPIKLKKIGTVRLNFRFKQNGSRFHICKAAKNYENCKCWKLSLILLELMSLYSAMLLKKLIMVMLFVRNNTIISDIRSGVFMKITKQIRANIGTCSQGTPFVSSELLSLASREIVDETLSRRVRAGELTRIARGVYGRPKKSRFVGDVMPSVHEVVQWRESEI